MPQNPGEKTNHSPLDELDNNRHQALSDALKSSFIIIRFVMLAVVAVIVGSGVLMVEQNQVAILLRFGKPVITEGNPLLQPGLHFAFPDPIDEKVFVNVGEAMSVKSSVGWYKVDPEREIRGLGPEPKGFLVPRQDGYLMSADGNIFHAQATLKYRISDPLKFALDFQSTTNVLRDLLDNSLVHSAAQFTAQEAIYSKQAEFKEDITAQLNNMVNDYRLGIVMDPLDLEVRPPADVREAFEMVMAKDQEWSQLMSEAQSYKNEVTLKAIGEAEAIKLSGISRSNQVVRMLASDAEFFKGQIDSYKQNPSLFERRVMMQIVGPILTNATDIFLVPSGEGRKGELKIKLNPLPPASKSPVGPQ